MTDVSKETRQRFSEVYRRMKSVYNQQKLRVERGITSVDDAFWARKKCNSVIPGTEKCPVYGIPCKGAIGFEKSVFDRKTGNMLVKKRKCPVVCFNENAKHINGDSMTGEIGESEEIN